MKSRSTSRPSFISTISSRRRAALLGAAVMSTSLVAYIAPTSAFGQTLYWDRNGTTTGAGATPTGTWNATEANWNSASTGVTTAPGVWSTGTAVFSAGVDATSAYNVTIGNNYNAQVTQINIEEGNPTFVSGGGTAAVTFTGTTGTFNFTNSGSFGVPVGGTNFYKTGAATVNFTAPATLTGVGTVNAGGFILYGSSGGGVGGGTALSMQGFDINTLAWMTLDNTAGYNNDRLSSTASINLNGSQLRMLGSTGATITTSETFGTLSINKGANLVNVVAQSSGGNPTSLTTSQLIRNGQSTLFVRANGLGTGATGTVSRFLATNGNALMVGGGGAEGTTTVGVIPWITAEDTNNVATQFANPDVVTYGANGFRILRSNEYVNSIPASATLDNVSLSGAASVASTTGANVLRLNGVNANVTIATGQTLSLNAGQVHTMVGATSTISGGTVSATTGELMLTGAGSVNIASDTNTTNITKTNSGTATLSGASNASGTVTVNQGVLIAAHNNAFGTAAVRNNNSGTVSQLTGIIGFAGNVTVNNNITIAGPTSTGTGGPGSLHAFSGNNTIAGNVTLEGAGANLGDTFLNTIGADAGATLKVSGVISGGPGNGLTKVGAGTVVLSGSNTHTGVMRVFGGTLVAESDNAFGTSGGGVFANTPSGNPTHILPTTIAFRAPASSSGFQYNSLETIQLAGFGNTDDIGALDNFGGDNLFAGTISLANDMPLAGNNVGTPNAIGVNSGKLTLTGQLSNSSTTNQRMLSKVGPGELVIASAQTLYGGQIFVETGTLTFGGSAGNLTPRNPSGGGGTLQTSVDVMTGASLKFDNTNSAINNRINLNGLAGGVPVRLVSADFTLVGKSDAATNVTSVGGSLNLYGHSSITMGDAGAGNTFDSTSGTLIRQSGATMVFRGSNLGTAAPGSGINTVLLPAALSGSLSGGTGGAGTSTQKILPFAVGDTLAAGAGRDFVTYDATNGVRVLQESSGEYYTGTINGLAGGDQNALVNGAQNVSSPSSINSLKLSGAAALTVSDTLTVNSGAILNASGSVAIISGSGTLAFGSAEGVIYANDNMTVNPLISGTGGLIKSGNGALTLANAANNFGTLTLNSGTVIVSADSQLGTTSSAISFNGGFLKPTSALNSLDSNHVIITNAKDGGFDIASGQSFTVGSNITGSGRIVKTGGGELLLNGTNTFKNGLWINGGTVTVTSDAALGTTSLTSATSGTNADQVGEAQVEMDGGALKFTQSATLSSARSFQLRDGGGTFDVGAGLTLTSPAYIIGRGALYKVGDGTMVSSNAFTTPNRYLGRTNILGGTLQYTLNANSNVAGLSMLPGNLIPDYFYIDNGAALELAATQSSSTGSMSIGNSFRGITFGSNGGKISAPTGVTFTLNQPLAGAGTFTKVGAGTVTLAGSVTGNDFTGKVVVDTGYLFVGADSRLGAAPTSVVTDAIQINGGATFGTTSNNTAIHANRGIKLLGGTSVIFTAGSMFYGGSITGTGNLTKTGAQFLNLSGQSSYVGDTTVSVGTINIGTNDALPTSTKVTLASSTYLNLADANLVGFNQTIAGLSGSGNVTSGASTVSTLTINSSSSNNHLGVVSGPVKIVKSGSTGTQFLSGTNTYTGGSLVNDGTLVFNTTASTGTGTITATGGLAKFTADQANAAKVAGISTSGTGAVDLTNDKLIVNYDVPANTPIASIRTQLQSGFNGGTWDGPGIRSSNAAANPGTGIGYAESGAAGTFFGTATDANDIVMRYTYLGDANLDGSVDSTDFNNSVGNAANYGLTSGAVWAQGDFNYDGKVSTLDFNYLAGNFGAAAIPAPLPGASLGAVVPEPASLSVIALGLVGLASRRRRA